MEASSKTSQSPPPNQRRRVGERRRSPGLSRGANAWSQLLLSVNLLRVAAATGGWLPATAIADAWWGVGHAATAGGVLAAGGLLRSLATLRGDGALLRIGCVVLLAAHAATLVVFPTRWLVDWVQTPDALFYVETDRPVFALTIDDGLDPATTPAILEVLREHDAHATFFVLGQSLLDYPALARRCLAEGHELANHQMTDTPAVALPPGDLAREIRDAHEALSRFARPRWFRPGGGIPTDQTERLVPQLGCRTALGSVFPYDSHVPSAAFASAFVAGRTAPGEIVVLHDGQGRGARTAGVLNEALGQLAERGLRAVTLSELAAE